MRNDTVLSKSKITLPGYKQIEYVESLNMLRFHLDLRSKALNFSIVINGALLTVVLSYLQDSYSKIIISIFGLLLCLSFLGLSLRSMKLVDIYKNFLLELEEELGISLVTKTTAIHFKKGLKARHYFDGIYFLLIVLWAFVAIDIIYK